MSEDSFILPVFQDCMEDAVQNFNHDFFDAPIVVKQKRADRKLTYNHYADCSKRVEIRVNQDAGKDSRFSRQMHKDDDRDILEQKLINGYDGFGGVHDNLIWNSSAGYTYFTLNNKFIIENTKTRDQTVFADSTVQLSCMASTANFKLVAVA